MIESAVPRIITAEEFWTTVVMLESTPSVCIDFVYQMLDFLLLKKHFEVVSEILVWEFPKDTPIAVLLSVLTISKHFNMQIAAARNLFGKRVRDLVRELEPDHADELLKGLL